MTSETKNYIIAIVIILCAILTLVIGVGNLISVIKTGKLMGGRG